MTTATVVSTGASPRGADLGVRLAHTLPVP